MTVGSEKLKFANLSRDGLPDYRNREVLKLFTLKKLNRNLS